MDMEKTMHHKDIGEDVVKDSVSQVESVLGGTKGMLRDIAKVESDDGKHENTFTGASNGIWQIDDIGLKDTQLDTSAMKRAHAKIKKEFGIDWKQITTEDLKHPLINAIAARLVLLRKPEAIPDSKEAQAAYWKKYYNTEAGKGTVEKYLKRIK